METLYFGAHLRQLFVNLNITTVLDVGANAGQYRDFLRHHVGFNGNIVSFEPIDELVNELTQKSATDQKWQIYPWALGATHSQAMFNVARTTQFSSFLKSENSLVPAFEPKNIADRQELVEVRRLDTVFSTILSSHSTGRVFLKMDTQGYDLEVMKSASGVLDKIAALQTEISLLPIYVGMPDYLTSLKTLTESGFDVTYMVPAAQDKHLRVVEFDCVMINRASINPSD